ncbi:hypothetical protein F0U62_31540 [Cystobacter fuscus]|uniref:DUF5953 family protein n=1 Tax=Cystobacter fuscus TaxID=43 RepID=UPI002B2A22BD|nr:hypothetical protein F0U62_31540 [Cystobacter fuscus]
MTATKRSLDLIVYAPALVGGDSRPLAVVHGMERALPGLHLEWKISDEGRPVPLPQRDAWVAQGRSDGPGVPLLCNGDESQPITISGWVRPAGVSSGGQPQFDVHAELPLDAVDIEAAADVLEAVGEGAHAFWGRLLLEEMAVMASEQFRHPGDEPHVPPKGLPSLELPWELPAPEIPHYLGWMNYWSAAAARAIGFPDFARDADLLSRSRRTATGGWVVRLTEAPLDLDNPAHLDALKRTYERFPEIGGRSTP